MAERGHGGNYLLEASGWALEKNKRGQQREASVASKGVDCCHFSGREQLLQFVKSKPFEMASCLVIAANAVFMGIKCQVQVQSLSAGEPFNSLGFDIFEKLFAAFFVLEWAARVFAYQKWFLRAVEWKWHVFDTLLVLAAIVDEILTAASAAVGGQSVVLRIFRIIRLLRLLRIMRYVTVFRELRLMVYGILSSARALLWSYVMIFMIIYGFSVCFVQAVIGYIKKDGGDQQDVVTQNLLDNFGSLLACMRTLFFAVSGGANWADYVVMLDHVDAVYGLLFLVYILLVIHGVLHVVAGIFVESAMSTSKEDDSEQFVLELARKDSHMNQMKLVLEEADLDKSGTINWQEFQAKLKDERLQAYFGAMELDPSEARGLFKLLDTDESDEVPIDEFVTGCFRLKGSAKGLDLASLMHENKKMMRIFMKFMSYTQEQFEELSKSLAVHNALLEHSTQ